MQTPPERPLGLILLRAASREGLRSLPLARAWALTLDVLRAMLDRYRAKHPQALDHPPPELQALISANLSALEALYEVQGTRGALLGELLLLELSMRNPALAALRPRFDTAQLHAQAPLGALMKALRAHLDDQAPLEPSGRPLMQALEAPALASPDALQGQIEHLLGRCKAALSEAEACALLRARDHLREAAPRRRAKETTTTFADLRAGAEGALALHLTQDSAWMSDVVMIAKQTFVWLDQLSKRYGRPITRLDQIPNAELDQMKGAGFTALWLVGLWERSKASKRIKHITGQRDAEASAYALHDYQIADRLGGEDALQDLMRRALQRGIRLAADMVPNHVGIDGRWVLEHPDWFLQLDHPPFESYSFDGPDLCQEQEVSIQIEDGYFDRSDASVVFKRTDTQTGEVRYIYHGNDGTLMPWNDTAQLDHLNPEVREAVIQTFVEVARRFPIIRIDAAMTLTRQHMRRLWHPAPGEGGAIPSRASYGISAEAFEAALPKELWRELIERVQREAPDTLLLAEAFWGMEGYFVHTLGVHRVYNSAFMHILRDEQTGEYRRMLRELIDHAPAVLERFVNFMNNPDEETALTQFGDDEKYFGAATVMVTLPGLPLFGHGQVEGLKERYGMEYGRAYAEEPPDETLIARHRQKIFPLMRRRHLFSSAKRFRLHDLLDERQRVNEDVLIYSNHDDRGQRALIAFNNCARPALGWIQATPALLEILAPNDMDRFIGLKDNQAGLWYLRSVHALREQGLFISLPGYCCQVFLEFRALQDPDERWAALSRSLRERGVPDLDAARDAALGFLEFSADSEKNHEPLIAHVHPAPRGAL